MRRWQLAKLRAAGLDTYAPRTWAEAQVALAQQSTPVISAPAVPRAVHTNINDSAVPKPRGGKAAKPCPYCGVEFKALHWHVDKCKMRPAA